MVGHAFQIDSLRSRLFRGLKRRVGIRNFKLICSLVFVGLLLAIVLPLSLNAKEENTFAVSDFDVEKVIDVRFLNTYNNEMLGDDSYKSNEANLIKTKDDKYVLIDTGNKNEKIVNIIYRALYDYQNNDIVTIDYLIVTHMHPDHYGNAYDILNDDRFDVKNFVIKYGKNHIDKYDKMIRKAKEKNITIYTNSITHKVDGVAMQDYPKYKKMNTEGTGNAVIGVGEYLKLYFYNTVNVYSDCIEGYYRRLYLASREGSDGVKYFTKDSSGRYLELDNSGLEYPNISFDYSNSLKTSETGGFQNYYYVGFAGEDSAANGGEYTKTSSCNENGNSYGILAEVKTADGNKYIYFSNDIENIGYDVLPATTDVTYYSTSQKKNVTKKGHDVYGTGRTTLYARPDLELVRTGDAISKDAVYSESKVALEIADKMGNNLSDLVIYQQSHHGISNAPDALDTLELNRGEVYAVANRISSLTAGYTGYIFGFKRANYNLKETKKKMYAGYGEGDGVYCAIDNTGDYLCSYHEIKVNKLVYDLNGGVGDIPEQYCLGDSSCSMTINAYKPTRSGFRFLGWATSPFALRAAYGVVDSLFNSIEVKGETTLYAIYGSNCELNYNMNGGVGSIDAQIGSSLITNGDCSIVVDSFVPLRDNYRFLGWSTSDEANNAEYTAGSTVTLTGSGELYAVWQRLININTAVDGGNGTITPSMSDVPEGKTVTISFSPNSDYEIDNVKVNDVKTVVTDNKLTLTAGDEDINVVVKYKLSNEEPLSPPIVRFNMIFGAASGESGTPETLSCFATGTPGCEVTIPEAEPVRNGYVFLGYGLNKNRNVAVYYPGETYTIEDDIYVVSVWAPVYTLNYDYNGVEGVVASSTCYPTERANGVCSIIINRDPTRADSEFFGWATSPRAEAPEYLTGDTFTFSSSVRTVTLYAIWADGGIEWYQGQEYTRSSGVDLIVGVNYPMSSFASLMIDNNVVNTNSYAVTSGSTVITIDSEYVNTLSVGEHELRAIYNNDAVAQTAFTVQEKVVEENNVSDDETGSNDDEYADVGGDEGDNDDAGDIVGDDESGDNPGGDDPGGDNPGGDNPGGDDPGGDNPGGDNPGGDNPGGDNPGGSNPGENNTSDDDGDDEGDNWNEENSTDNNHSKQKNQVVDDEEESIVVPNTGSREENTDKTRLAWIQFGVIGIVIIGLIIKRKVTSSKVSFKKK